MASNTKGKPRCHCGSTMTLARHVSFVDCPGHEMLMCTLTLQLLATLTSAHRTPTAHTHNRTRTQR